ncbi:hypothetical protein BDE02_13G064000 [Populus trichocarpa]|nr:hypothetical protein BDE02_13G064000 [Populus trichocarpa]
MCYFVYEINELEPVNHHLASLRAAWLHLHQQAGGSGHGQNLTRMRFQRGSHSRAFCERILLICRIVMVNLETRGRRTLLLMMRIDMEHFEPSLRTGGN